MRLYGERPWRRGLVLWLLAVVLLVGCDDDPLPEVTGDEDAAGVGDIGSDVDPLLTDMGGDVQEDFPEVDMADAGDTGGGVPDVEEDAQDVPDVEDMGDPDQAEQDMADPDMADPDMGDMEDMVEPDLADPDMPDMEEPEGPAIQEELSDTPIQGQLYQGGRSVHGSAHLAMGEMGGTILNTTDPANVVTWGSFDTPGQAMDVAVDDTTQTDYVADGDQGVAVVAWGDPEAPELVMSTEPEVAPVTAVALDPAQSLLYAAAGPEVVIFDVRLPREPVRVGAFSVEVSQGASCLSLRRHGRWIYALYDDGALRALNPQTLEVAWSGQVDGGAQMAIVNQVLVVTLTEGLAQAWSLEDPANPTPVALDSTTDPARALLVSGAGSLLAFSGPGAGVWCYGSVGAGVELVALPAAQAPTPLHLLATEGGVLAIYEDRAAFINTPPFVVDSSPREGDQGVYLDSPWRVTLSEPVDPESVDDASALLFAVGGFLPTAATVRQVGPVTLELDPLEPLSPQTTYEGTVLSQVRDLQGASLTPLNGHRDTFTTGSELAPGDLGQVGEDLALEGSPLGADVQGELAFTCLESGQLQITDMSDETAPAVLSSLSLEGPCQSVVADPTRPLVYVTAGAAGVVIVDVQNPAQPAVLSTWRPEGVQGEALACDYDRVYNRLYVSFGAALVAVDVYVPASPRLVLVGEPGVRAITHLRLWRDRWVAVTLRDGSLHVVARDALSLLGAPLYRGADLPLGLELLGDTVHIGYGKLGLVSLDLLVEDGAVSLRRLEGGGVVDVTVVDRRPGLTWLARRGSTLVVTWRDGRVVVYGHIHRPGLGWHRARLVSRGTARSLRIATVTRGGLVRVGWRGGWRLLNLPPYLVYTDPLEAQEEVRPGTVVRAFFSEPVEQVGQEPILSLEGPEGPVDTTVVSWSDGATLGLRPGAVLAPQAGYSLRVRSSVADRRGLALWTAAQQPVVTAFTTGELAQGETVVGFDLDEGTRRLVVVGDTGYACGASGRLQVLDMSSGQPQAVTSLEVPGVCEDLLVDEAQGRLYVAMGDGGLVIFSVEQPRSPIFVRVWTVVAGVEGPCTALSLDPDRPHVLYVGIGGQVVAVDFRDLANIAVILRLGTPWESWVYRVRVHGAHLVVLLRSGAVVTLLRETLAVVSTVALGEDPVGLEIINGGAYVGFRGGRVLVLPIGVDGVLGDSAPLGERTGLVRFGYRGDSLVCVYDDGVVEIYGVVWRGGVRTVVRLGQRSGYGRVLVVSVLPGGSVWLVYQGGYSVLDAPPFVVSVSPAPGAVGVSQQVQPQVVFSEPVTLGQEGVALLQGEAPVAATVQQEGARVTLAPEAALEPLTGYTVAISGQVTDASGQSLLPEEGLEVDFTTGSPVDDDTRGLVVVGDTGYLCGDQPRLQLLDMADPENPTLLDSLPLPALCEDLIADPEQGRLYVALGDAGLVVISIAQPRAPVVVRVHVFDGLGPCTALWLDPDAPHHVWVGVGGVLQLIDLSDPLALVLVRQLAQPLGGPVYRIRVRGAHLVVVLRSGAVVTLLRETLAVVSTVALGEDPVGLEIIDGGAYVGFRGGRVLVLPIGVDGVLGTATPMGDRSGLVRFGYRGDTFVCVYDDGVAEIYGVVLRGGVRVLSRVRVVTDVLRVRFVVVFRSYVLILGGGSYRVLDPPPFVVSTSPVDGESAVGLDVAPQVVFSEPVNLAPGALELVQGPDPVGFAQSAQSNGAVAVLTPDQALAAVTPYTLRVNPALVQDGAGQGLYPADVVEASFTTGTELDPGTRGLVVVGDTGYACGDRDRLQIMDLSDPENPITVDSVALPGVCEELVVDEDRGLLYVTAGDAGLVIFSISTPLAPAQVRLYGFNEVVGPCTSLALDPDVVGRVYVTVGRRVVVLDITTPQQITVVRVMDVDLAGPVYRIRVRGAHLVVVLRSGVVVTLARQTLVLVSSVALGEDPIGLEIIDGQVYVAYRGGRVLVVSVGVDGVLGTPVPLGDRPGVVRFGYRGDTFVCVYDDGTVEVYGFVLRSGVRVLTRVRTWTGYTNTYHVVIYRGGRVLVVYERGYGTLDTPPFVVSTTPLDGEAGVAVDVQPRVVFSEPVALDGDELALSLNGVPVPGQVSLALGNRAAVFTPSQALEGDSAYVMTLSPQVEDLSGQSLLPDQVLEVNFQTEVLGPPSAPEVGSFEAPLDPRDMVVVGDFAYLAAGDEGVVVLDLSDPASPQRVGVVVTAGPAVQVVADESRGVLYVACGAAGVVVIDIRDPRAAVVVTTFGLPSGVVCNSITYANGAVYCGAGSQVYVLRIDTRLRLRVVQTLTYTAEVVQVRVRGARIYCTHRDGRVVILGIDVDPFNPVVLGGFTVPLEDGHVIGGLVLGEDGLVYVSVRGGGVRIYDVRDPGAVVFVRTLPGTGSILSGRLRDGVLVCVYADGYIDVYSLRDPRNPVLITRNVVQVTRVVISYYRGYLLCIDGSRGHVLNVPPFVVAAWPGHGATGVGTRGAVSLSFSEPVTLGQGALSLRQSQIPVPTAPFVSAAGLVHGLLPDADLAESTTYATRLTTDVVDSTGMALGAPLELTFTTGAQVLGPAVDVISDTTTFAGRVLEIQGGGFGLAPEALSVWVAGVPASVVERQEALLRVLVPAGAYGRSGRVTVVNARGVAVSRQVLTVSARPTLLGISPQQGASGQSVTLTGANFDADEAENTRVWFGGVEVGVVEVQPDSVTFVVPLGAFSSTVVVSVGGVYSNGVYFTSTTPDAPNSWYQGNNSPDASRRVAHTTVYRELSNELILFGGATGDPRVGGVTINDLYALDLNTFTWRDIPDPVNQPVSRNFHHTIYIPEQDRMVIMGGNNADPNVGEIYQDVWSYSFETGQWTQEATSVPGMGFRQAGSFEYHRPSGRGFLVAGFNQFAQPLNDVWVYDAATHEWSQMATTGQVPPARGAHFSQVVGDELYIFGGQTSASPSSQTVRNDVYALNLNTGVWRLVTPGGVGPTARAGTAGVYDPVGNRLVLYGGTQGGTPFRDVIALDLDTNTWSNITPTTGQLPPIRAYHTANHFESGNLMVVYGGIIDISNPVLPQFYGDVWVGILE